MNENETNGAGNEVRRVALLIDTDNASAPYPRTTPRRWYRVAAEQGNAIAQAKLGASYAYGKGVPEDDLTAYAWLNIAAGQGQSIANEVKESVAKHMTQTRIAKAHKLPKEYWTRYVMPFQVIPRTLKEKMFPN